MSIFLSSLHPCIPPWSEKLLLAWELLLQSKMTFWGFSCHCSSVPKSVICTCPLKRWFAHTRIVDVWPCVCKGLMSPLLKYFVYLPEYWINSYTLQKYLFAIQLLPCMHLDKWPFALTISQGSRFCLSWYLHYIPDLQVWLFLSC